MPAGLLRAIVAGQIDLGAAHDMTAIRAVCTVFVGVAAIATAAVAQQQWPARPILGVSPFVAGTTNDLIAGLVLDQAAKQLGQPFVIENRPGGGGSVGVTSVVHAAPDGYTLLLSSSQ